MPIALAEPLTELVLHRHGSPQSPQPNRPLTVVCGCDQESLLNPLTQSAGSKLLKRCAHSWRTSCLVCSVTKINSLGLMF